MPKKSTGVEDPARGVFDMTSAWKTLGYEGPFDEKVLMDHMASLAQWTIMAGLSYSEMIDALVKYRRDNPPTPWHHDEKFVD